jgi:hypothetical protein
LKPGVAGSIVGLGAALLLLVTGCGGSGSSLTKAEFIKEANLVCQEAASAKEEALGAALAKFGGGKITRADQVKALLFVLRPYDEATEKIDGLGAPKGEAEKVEALVEAREEATARTKADPDTTLVSDTPFKKAQELAEKYGLDRCAA